MLAEGTPVLDLPGDVLADDLGVDLGLLDLLDLDLELLLGQLLHLLGKLLDVGTLGTDDDAGAGRGDHHGDALGLADDLDVGDVGVLDLGACKQALAEDKVLMECVDIVPRIDVPL